MAGGPHLSRILIVAAEPAQAEAVLQRLHASLPGVHGLFARDPSELRARLSEQPWDGILVRVGGAIAAGEVAAVCREADLSTPMLILDQDGCDPAELVELMSACGCGLIRDIDDDRLPALVRRWVGQADAAARPSALDQQAVQSSDPSLELSEPGHSHAAPLNQSIDAETGLPDRRALLEVLAQRLADDDSQDRYITLFYARMEDFSAVCRGYGLTRGLEHAATTASQIRAAMPEDAFAARVADDACAILTQDAGEPTSEKICERLRTRLAAAAPNAETPSLQLGLASARPGETTASSLLDDAYADCLMDSPAKLRTAADAEPPLQLPSALDSLQPLETRLSGPRRRAFGADSKPLADPAATPRGQPGRRQEAPSRPAVELKLGPEFVPEVGFKHEPKRGAWSQPESASGRGLGADPAADTDADSDSDTLSLAPQTTPYTSALDDEMREDGVTASIERALETDGFTVMYQPIISLMGDSQEHYSVLVRLRGEHDRLLTAHELLGPAARAGSLPDVDRWVMQRAFQEQARRRRLGQKVSLFLSLSKEIVQDERLLISICDSLREFEIRGSWVTFQFQQSEALALGDKWTLLADGLKRIQCRICVNQVGLTDDTEQAMDTMQADFVKFAPELAIGLATEQAIQKRLLQLINSAQERGVKTIVTGVEDARSLALLWSTGIGYVQGNFLQRALPNLDAPT